jgi:hypothetical protein
MIINNEMDFQAMGIACSKTLRWFPKAKGPRMVRAWL